MWSKFITKFGIVGISKSNKCWLLFADDGDADVVPGWPFAVVGIGWLPDGLLSFKDCCLLLVAVDKLCSESVSLIEVSSDASVSGTP